MAFKLPLRALTVFFVLGAALVLAALIGTGVSVVQAPSTAAPTQSLGAPAIQ